MRTRTIPLRWLVLALITLAAAALRLVDLGSVRLDPFYDAAVRSMGVSWHNFFFGAYEPGGSVSIDKPPVDLWLQVASVKLLGWSATSLKLPEALAGTASVPLLYAAVRRPFGSAAGLVAALALAVMPIEVITARSDTMDSAMMLLLVVALLAFVRASESTAWLVAGAAALGLAFDVKLLESLVALPGLLMLAWLAQSPSSEGSTPQSRTAYRARRLGLAAGVYVAVALSWLTATSFLAGHERPYAIGSTNGSAWNAAFVFNGLDRLESKTFEAARVRNRAPTNGHPARSGQKPIAAPSPTRLLAHDGQLPARWFGWQALAALLLGIAAIISLARKGQAHVQRATVIGVFVWLVTGVALFSAMTRLHPRYVESVTPAIAAMWGIGVGSVIAGLRGRVRLLALPVTSLLTIGVLALGLFASIEAVGDKSSDAGEVGALHPSERRALSAYLLAHQDGAHYELAAGSATSVASLIAEDARPMVMLTTYAGRPLTSVARLRALIARGEVHYALIEPRCVPDRIPRSPGCAPAARWVRAHAVDVSRAAGLHANGTLWRLQIPVA